MVRSSDCVPGGTSARAVAPRRPGGVSGSADAHTLGEPRGSSSVHCGGLHGGARGTAWSPSRRRSWSHVEAESPSSGAGSLSRTAATCQWGETLSADRTGPAGRVNEGARIVERVPPRRGRCDGDAGDDRRLPRVRLPEGHAEHSGEQPHRNEPRRVPTPATGCTRGGRRAGTGRCSRFRNGNAIGEQTSRDVRAAKDGAPRGAPFSRVGFRPMEPADADT
jgi:hypothetical protein